MEFINAPVPQPGHGPRSRAYKRFRVFHTDLYTYSSKYRK